MRNDVLVETRTEKSNYSVGEEVKMSITMENKGRGTIELIFTSAQRYDFLVLKDGKEIWRWSDGKVFGMVLGHLLLKSGEKQTYTEAWKPEDAAPGEYEVIGAVTSQPAYKTASTFKISS